MKQVRIEWLYDENDCDTCGGGFAQGARIYLDGELAADLTPVAHCYDGTHYDDSEVYGKVVELLGGRLEEAYLD